MTEDDTMKLFDICAQIRPPDQQAMADARARWDSIAKPLGSLGQLEDAVVRIAGLTGSASVCLDRRTVIVFCADNGVVAEGVTQTDASVTAIMAGSIARGDSCVCKMAAAANAAVLPIDIGMARPVAGVRDLCIARGTGNLAHEPAMTRVQAERALLCGVRLAEEMRDSGCRVLITGEMGIGNTTSAAAVASVLLGIPPKTAVGRGAGLSDEGLIRKLTAVESGIRVNCPNPDDALDVLCKVGGFDIAGMAGLYLGGALYRVPVVVDGLISAVAALVAYRLCPACACAMLASHASAEPASMALLSAVGLSPCITAGLRLGEGTGGICLLPLLDLALSVYRDMSTYGDVGLEPYRKLGGEGV